MLDSSCNWEDCDRPAFSKGLCQRCYMRARRAGNVGSFRSPDVLCRRCGIYYSEGTKSGKYFCSKQCQLAQQHEDRAMRRVLLLGERTCGFCQGPVPLELRNDARNCSVRCQQASWYLQNDDRLRKAARVWARQNPDSRLEMNERRRARKLALQSEPVDIAAVWDRDEGKCWICSSVVPRDAKYPHPLSRSLDHVIPLAKGGGHTFSNVALAHLRCNISKQDRLLESLPHWFELGREEEPGVVTISV